MSAFAGWKVREQGIVWGNTLEMSNLSHDFKESAKTLLSYDFQQVQKENSTFLRIPEIKFFETREELEEWYKE